MKQLFLIALLFGFTSCVIAQTNGGLPRWGSGPPQNDNTGRVLTHVVKPITASSITTTQYQVPNAYETIFNISTLGGAITDSIGVVNSQGVYTAYAGDKVTLVFTADANSGGRVVTLAGAYVHYVSTTLTVPQSKKAAITFVFDGQMWIEMYRSVMNN